MQGSRLTVWELQQDGIDATLIADAAASHLMKDGQVDWVVVGADRHPVDRKSTPSELQSLMRISYAVFCLKKKKNQKKKISTTKHTTPKHTKTTYQTRTHLNLPYRTTLLLNI